MTDNELTYEQAMARLETISRQIESNELGIDQMASKLKEAQQLTAFCRKQLYQVDEEIKEILGEK